jgi:hypothetical protein
MFTAYTEELDDADDAVAELLEQIDFEELGAHTVGLITCSYDFIESGIVDELVEKLPFDLVGMSTMASASCGVFAKYRLMLNVLTADDVQFSTAVTGPLDTGNLDEEIQLAYERALSGLPDKPVFIIGFFPLLRSLGGEDMVIALDAASGQTPIWGSIGSGDDMSYSTCRTIFNSTIDQAVLALIAVSGEVEPEFILTSIPDNHIRNYKGLITSSEGSHLKTVDNIPTLDYIRELGVILNPNDYTTVPLLLDNDDGSRPVALAIYSMNDDGSIVCGGRMPEGAYLSLGMIDHEGILETAATSLREILEAAEQRSVALLLPCVTRYIMLSPQQDSEMLAAIGALDGVVPYALGYSGGEVCPMRRADGSWVNRFHNFSFSACVL